MRWLHYIAQSRNRPLMFINLIHRIRAVAARPIVIVGVARLFLPARSIETATNDINRMHF